MINRRERVNRMTNKALAKIFKALGDETRLEIVRMLSGKERCVCAFLNYFAMSQPAISNHLRVLREADVVIDKLGVPSASFVLIGVLEVAISVIVVADHRQACGGELERVKHTNVAAAID